MPQKEYALLCEFMTQSTNGLYTYAHVFDRTLTQEGAPIAINAFLVARLRETGKKPNVEIYLTDESNTLVEKGQIFRQAVDGPDTHIVIRLRGLKVPSTGVYRFWTRVDSGEPMLLCTWVADRAPKKV